ncbi:MAG TPA: AroM family protein [Rhodopila sp.]|uniref:AroM family protein n=1 Tax=Rhodopila sp. TaxID=2480087 RepID=UPI002C8C2CA8|nr:AroM family protein [Rhodopila sp.]HVY15484.1 AroM family protein [Rhodopila sp.]
MPKRIAFVTIGQSPRDDVMPDIAAECRTVFTPTEIGVLDDLDEAGIAACAPRPGDSILVSRLRDGRGVLLGKPAVERRLHAIFAALDTQGFDLVVLLCTGTFGHFTLRTRFLEPQLVVDNFMPGLAYGAKTLGALLPEPGQAADFAGLPGVATVTASASPYAADPFPALRDAGARLADADMIMMHCIGFTEAMRQAVMQAAGRPVLLSRRLVAHAIDLLLT